VTIRAGASARSFPVGRRLRACGNWRASGSAFGACCCAGKLRSPAPLTASPASPGPAPGTSTGPPNPRQRPAKAPPQVAYRSCAGWSASPLVASPAGGQSVAKTATDWPPAGERSERLPMRQPDPAVWKPPSAAID
jgi:hypothetical protein